MLKHKKKKTRSERGMSLIFLCVPTVSANMEWIAEVRIQMGNFKLCEFPSFEASSLSFKLQ